MGSRTWIKVYCDRWLEGTISEEPISVRGVWISLLALAGNGKYGDSGEIKALDGVGFNNNQVAAMLKVPLNLWVATKNRLEKTGRVTISTDNIITIVNWKKYQSEYERTSKYRIKGTTNATEKGTLRDKRIENRDKRIEISSSDSQLKEDTQVNNLSDDMAEIATLYEAEIGRITSFVAQELNDAMQNYPADRIKGAIKEAVRQNVRKWSYISKVLENWGKEGKSQDLISGQSVEKAIKIARGELEASKRVISLIKNELDKRGIKWRD